jgi:hypothetical protein
MEMAFQMKMINAQMLLDYAHLMDALMLIATELMMPMISAPT